MRLRSSRTLVWSREGKQLVAFNFLSGDAFACSADLLTFLVMLDHWTEPDAIAPLVPTLSCEEIHLAVEALLEVNALTEEYSTLALQEERFEADWRWGVPAALFHRTLHDKDRQYLSIEEGEDLQRERAASFQQPELYRRHDLSSPSVTRLPDGLEDNTLLQLMARRRTIRSSTGQPIRLPQLSDCLFAGLGITGFTTNCVGILPLSMTPSGGARNPYEGYVYARQVEGLDPGWYHYSANDHSLLRLDTSELPAPSTLFGGQKWTDEMPCLIILAAFFGRTMWKYSDANAYRVVMIEAGHVAQNVMLAATHHGLSAAPTAALHHAAVSRYIGLRDDITCAPIYALALGHPVQS